MFCITALVYSATAPPPPMTLVPANGPAPSGGIASIKPPTGAAPPAPTGQKNPPIMPFPPKNGTDTFTGSSTMITGFVGYVFLALQ